jgi:hypothetical protein
MGIYAAKLKSKRGDIERKLERAQLHQWRCA